MKAKFQRLSKMEAIELPLISLRLREGRVFWGFKEGIRDQIRELEDVLRRRKTTKF